MTFVLRIIYSCFFLQVKGKLREMYDEGRRLKWKIPEIDQEEDDLEYGLFPTT